MHKPKISFVHFSSKPREILNKFSNVNFSVTIADMIMKFLVITKGVLRKV